MEQPTPSDPPWYHTFFGEDYLRIYDWLTPERTEQEVEGIATLLGLPGGKFPFLAPHLRLNELST